MLNSPHRSDEQAPRVAVFLRTHQDNSKVRDAIETLKGGEGYDFYILAHEEPGRELQLGDAPKLSFSLQTLRNLGFEVDDPYFMVHCADLLFAVMQRAHPRYDHYVMVQHDVFVQRPQDRYFDRLAAALTTSKPDLVAVSLARSNPGWMWHAAAAAVHEVAMACFFPVVCLSKPAIAHLLEARLMEQARLKEAGVTLSESGRAENWMFCEAFTPSVLRASGGFDLADLNALVPDSYAAASFNVGPPRFLGRQRVVSELTELVCPVLDGEEFLDRSFFFHAATGTLGRFLDRIEDRVWSLDEELLARFEAAARKHLAEAGRSQGVESPRLEHLTLTEEVLAGRVWSLGRPGDWPYALHVTLLPKGVIGGVGPGRDASWTVVDGKLLFLDSSDLPSIVFDEVRLHSTGRLILLGSAQELEGGASRVLRETAPLSSLRSASAAPEVRTRSRRRRSNLLVLRAGDSSLHPSWPRDIPEAERNWDLCISHFGDPEAFGRDDIAEHQVLQTRERKFEALYALFHAASPFWDYDYVAFPDDDLMLSWRDWNQLFSICRRFDLDLAQPAIAGHPNQAITEPHPDYLLRYTSWVESMTPVFSRRALQICMPTLRGSATGYGLDSVWPKLLGEPLDRIAIVDAVVAVHTRPGNTHTTGYDYEAAVREGAEIQGRYGAPWRTLEYGGIRREALDRHAAG